MLHFPRWKVLAILAVVLAGAVFALPNFMPRQWQESVREYTGLKPMKRGLDLRGGSSIVVELDRKTVLAELVVRQKNDIRAALRKLRIGYNLDDVPNGVMATIRKPSDAERAREILQHLTSPIDKGFIVARAATGIFSFEQTGRQFTFTVSDKGAEAHMSRVVAQTMGILEERLSDVGFTGAIVQRLGRDRILIEVPTEGSSQVNRVPQLITMLSSDTPIISEHASGLGTFIRSGAVNALVVYRLGIDEFTDQASAKGLES